jgi:hypothetical protein
MVHFKKFLLVTLFATPFSALFAADDIVRSFVVKYTDAVADSTLKISSIAKTTVTSSALLKVASYSDEKKNVFTISNSAKYDAPTKTFTNRFVLQKQAATEQSPKQVADVEVQCTLKENETACRVPYESSTRTYVLNLEVESAVVAPVDTTKENVVEVTIDSSSSLVNSGHAQSKVLQHLQDITRVAFEKDNVIYSDSKSGSFLNLKTTKDASGNIGLSFTGKNGDIYIVSQSGTRAVFELQGTILDRLGYKRSLNAEPVLDTAISPVPAYKSSNLDGILVYPLSGGQKKINYSAELLYDAAALKPDSTQANYSEGKGLLVQKEADVAGAPLEAYWDVDATTADDLTRGTDRLSSFKIKNGDERTIKLRTHGGQRAALELGGSTDIGKSDATNLEVEWVQNN